MRGVRGGWAAIAGAAMLAGCSVVRRSPPPPPPIVGGVQVGVASWYGPGFHGNRTANGEIYDQHELTAAHPSLPLGTRVMVTSLASGRAVEVRINDRGPFVDGRIIDLSYAAARTIGMIGPGTARVRVEVLGRALPRLVPPPPRTPPEGSFSVEVATLRDAARAEHLRGVLAYHFPDAFVSPLVADAGRYYRVRLGPYALRAAAQSRAERVSRLGYPATIIEEAAR